MQSVKERTKDGEMSAEIFQLEKSFLGPGSSASVLIPQPSPLGYDFHRTGSFYYLLRRGYAYLHLITLSALASTFGEIVTPICFAALRLMTSSNLLGRSTGRSPGFAPFKILSTYSAARRN
jgi:hypothetical protein